MISLSLSNATLVLGARVLFRNLNWEIQHDQKIGLVGANGAGKSSLLKLMTSEYLAETGGSVVKARGVSIGYLPQHPEFPTDKTAIELAIEGNPRVSELEDELQKIESQMSKPETYNNPKELGKAIQLQQNLLDEYNSLGGYSYAGRVRELLVGLGISEIDFSKPIGLLSGGQKKLIGLVQLILLHPSILLLDEPDNHLDMPGKYFLEKLIQDYQGAVVIISHDRYMLDKVVTHIAEIEAGNLTSFTGNYTDFIIDKEQRMARQEDLFQIQQRAIGRMKLALQRYQLWVQFSDKFASRVRSMQTRLEKVNEINRPAPERRQIGLELSGWRGSNQVLEFININKSYSPRQLLRNANFMIRHGDRVGIIGANGAGKSVLFRLVLGKENADLGEIKIGPSVKIGYYAQEHETLDFNLTPIDFIRRNGNMTEANAVALLIRYLFTFQQCTQKISTLSGGERSRLQLAQLVLSDANFLLLDEPTNNLDIASAEVLESALMDFVGTVLVISHDRYFLDQTVNRILELKDGRLTEYTGGYSEYFDRITTPLKPGINKNQKI